MAHVHPSRLGGSGETCESLMNVVGMVGSLTTGWKEVRNNQPYLIHLVVLLTLHSPFIICLRLDA